VSPTKSAPPARLTGRRGGNPCRPPLFARISNPERYKRREQSRLITAIRTLPRIVKGTIRAEAPAPSGSCAVRGVLTMTAHIISNSKVSRHADSARRRGL